MQKKQYQGPSGKARGWLRTEWGGSSRNTILHVLNFEGVSYAKKKCLKSKFCIYLHMVAHQWNISGRIKKKKPTEALPERGGEADQGDRDGGGESSFTQLSLCQVYILSVPKNYTHTHTAASSYPNTPHGSPCSKLCSRWALWLLSS